MTSENTYWTKKTEAGEPRVTSNTYVSSHGIYELADQLVTLVTEFPVLALEEQPSSRNKAETVRHRKARDQSVQTMIETFSDKYNALYSAVARRNPHLLPEHQRTSKREISQAVESEIAKACKRKNIPKAAFESHYADILSSSSIYREYRKSAPLSLGIIQRQEERAMRGRS